MLFIKKTTSGMAWAHDAACMAPGWLQQQKRHVHMQHRTDSFIHTHSWCMHARAPCATHGHTRGRTSRSQRLFIAERPTPEDEPLTVHRCVHMLRQMMLLDRCHRRLQRQQAVGSEVACMVCMVRSAAGVCMVPMLAISAGRGSAPGRQGREAKNAPQSRNTNSRSCRPAARMWPDPSSSRGY